MALSEVHTIFDFRFNQGKLGAIERGTKRSATHLSTTAKNVDLFQQRVGGALKRIGQALAAYGAYRGLRLITSDYAKGADEIAKFSAGLGINAQAYQRMTYAAGLAGVTVEELNVALPNLAKRAGDAADGSKEAALAFRRAGVELKEGGKLKDPIRLLTDLADGMTNLKDEGRKTQILMALFGRSGKKMGVLLGQGAEGIKEAMKQADKLGFVLSGKQLKAAETYNDEMLRLKLIVQGVRNQVASRLLPALNDTMAAFRRWWTTGDNAERMLRRLKQGAIFTGIAVGLIVGQSVLNRLTLFVKGVWAGVKAMRALNFASAAAAAKVALVLAGFAAVYLIVEDLVYFAQGKDSLIGRLLGDSKLADELRTSLIMMATAAKDAWKEIGPALRKSWEDLKPALRELGEAIRPLIGPAFRAAVKGMIISFQGLAAIIRITAKGIKIQVGTWKTFAAGAKVVIQVLKVIYKSMTDIRYAATAAAAAIGAVTGRGKAGTALTAGAKAAQTAGSKITTGDILARQRGELPGGLRPAHVLPPIAPVPLAADLKMRGGTTVSTNVAAGAFPITVMASGDPQQIARAVATQVERQTKRVFTRASRDLKKPPAGQQ